MKNLFFVSLLLVLVFSEFCSADDWPQWLGPKRDSVWHEKGIVRSFPDDGLKVKWRVPVSYGYSGPAVVGDKVFVTDYVKSAGTISNNPGGRSKLEGSERLQCFSAETGKLIWKHEYDCSYNVSYAAGPRCTPTIDSGKVYSLGAEGNLSCVDAADGSVVWGKDLKKEYKTETPMWGFAAHPLVDENLLFCVVGGDGSVAVAFDKETGREVWRALSCDQPGYCPPTMIEHAGVKQLLIWNPDELNSLNPKTGKVFWTIPLKPAYRMSVAAPRKHHDFLFASGIGGVGAMMRLDNKRPGAKVIWRGTPKTAVYSCNSTPFIDDGTIYGSDCQTGALIAAQIEDGERLWETFKPTTGGQRRASHGTAYIVKHEDRFFLFTETGDLVLAELGRSGYKELGRFHVLEPTNECFGRDVVWSHPAFARKCVFARNDKELVCISLASGN